MRLTRSLVSVGLALVGGCTEAVRPSAGALAEGTWGGNNAGVIVTADVTHVHIGCTLGDIPIRVVADADGRFDVAGDYLLRAFPVAMGPRLPARFVGRVLGQTLVLTVTVNDTTAGRVETLGPVSVRLGDVPMLGPCPICTASTMAARRR